MPKKNKKYSKYVQTAFQIRNSCDYDDFFIASKQDAEEQYEKATELYEEVKAFLGKSVEKHGKGGKIWGEICCL